MHLLAYATHGNHPASPIVWIVLLGSAIVILWFFGFRPRHSKPMKDAAAGATVRAVGRGARRATARARSGKTPQPEDAS